MGWQQSDIAVKYLGEGQIAWSETEDTLGYFYELSSSGIQKQVGWHHLILVDLSLSMCLDLEFIKQSLKFILKKLGKLKHQTLSILIFSDEGTTDWVISELKSEEIELYLSELELRIDRLLTVYSIGCFSSALNEAIKCVELNRLKYKQQQVMVLTDANWGTLNGLIQEEIKLSQQLLLSHQDLSFSLQFLLFRDYQKYNYLKELVSFATFGSVHEVLNKSQCLSQIRQWLLYEPVLFTIENEHLFSTYDHHYYNLHEKLTLPIQKPIVLVLFEEYLKVNGVLVSKENVHLENRIMKSFRWSYSISLLRARQVKEAVFQLRQRPQLLVYDVILNGYSVSEINQSLYQLLRGWNRELFSHVGCDSFGSLSESLCLLEVLQMISQDQGSTLWWDYSLQPQSLTVNQRRERYRFVPFSFGLGKVCQIQIGSKKLNIGLKVKLEGQVEDQMTGLKLDAHVFRTFPLLINGELILKEVCCTLSPDVKKRMKQEKLIKKQWHWNGQEVLVLNLSKLKVTNERMGLRMPEEAVAQALYEIECLGCKRIVLKKMIDHVLSLKTYQSKKRDSNQLRKLKVQRQYGICDSGLFLPSTTISTDGAFYIGQYIPIIEWKIEGVKRQFEQQKAYEFYMKKLNEYKGSQIDWLFNELQLISERRQQLLDSVNLKRILLGIKQEPLCHWDAQVEKKKVQMDGKLKRNVILDGKVMISRKTINRITIRQNAYTLWVRDTQSK